MTNIKAFRPVVNEKKIFEDLTIFTSFAPNKPQKGPAPFYEQI